MQILVREWFTSGWKTFGLSQYKQGYSSVWNNPAFKMGEENGMLEEVAQSEFSHNKLSALLPSGIHLWVTILERTKVFYKGC